MTESEKKFQCSAAQDILQDMVDCFAGFEAQASKYFTYA
jgi:hypothetical protein